MPTQRAMATYTSSTDFTGEDQDGLGEITFPGSDDDLGIDDEEEDDSEPDFEPLEVISGSK